METNQETAIELLQKVAKSLRNMEILLPISKVVLNIDEVSKLTGISKSTIYKLTCSSEIPHYKKSKHLYFDRQEIEDWLKSHRVKTKDEIEAEALSYTTRREGLK